MENKLLFIITFACLYGFFELFISFIQRIKSIIIKSGDKDSIWFLFICIGLDIGFHF
jgi:hypothetical protein